MGGHQPGKRRKKESLKKSIEEEVTQENDMPAEDGLPEENLSLIDVLRSLSPQGFEKVTRELLRESGFANVEITGGSADGGIDGYGTLEINPFVSFKVLFQCKKIQRGKRCIQSPGWRLQKFNDRQG